MVGCVVDIAMAEETATLMYGDYIGLTHHPERGEWVMWGLGGATCITPDVESVAPEPSLESENLDHE